MKTARDILCGCLQELLAEVASEAGDASEAANLWLEKLTNETDAVLGVDNNTATLPAELAQLADQAMSENKGSPSYFGQYSLLTGVVEEALLAVQRSSSSVPSTSPTKTKKTKKAKETAVGLYGAPVPHIVEGAFKTPLLVKMTKAEKVAVKKAAEANKALVKLALQLDDDEATQLVELRKLPSPSQGFHFLDKLEPRRLPSALASLEDVALSVDSAEVVLDFGDEAMAAQAANYLLEKNEHLASVVLAASELIRRRALIEVRKEEEDTEVGFLMTDLMECATMASLKRKKPPTAFAPKLSDPTFFVAFDLEERLAIPAGVQLATTLSDTIDFLRRQQWGLTSSHMVWYLDATVACHLPSLFRRQQSSDNTPQKWAEGLKLALGSFLDEVCNLLTFDGLDVKAKPEHAVLLFVCWDEALLEKAMPKLRLHCERVTPIKKHPFVGKVCDLDSDMPMFFMPTKYQAF